MATSRKPSTESIQKKLYLKYRLYLVNLVSLARVLGLRVLPVILVGKCKVKIDIHSTRHLSSTQILNAVSLIS